MNRRGFISLLAGAAGATLVPWRGSIEPRIFLPAYEEDVYLYGLGSGGTFTNHLGAQATLTQESLEEMLARIRQYTHSVVLYPTQMIVSPQVKHLIDTDPVIRHAAELVLGRRL